MPHEPRLPPSVPRFDRCRSGRRGRAAGLGLALLAATGATLAGPRVETPSPILFLGERTRLERALGKFAIRNTGDAPLLLLGVEAECGCAVLSFDRKVAPGGTGFVEGEIDIEGVRGRMTTRISVETNDPGRPRLTLTLVAEVVGAVSVLPDDDVLLVTRPGSLPASRRVIRKETGVAGDLEVSALAPSAAWLQAKARPLALARPAGDGLPEVLPGDWLIEVSVVGEPAYGRRRESVQFSTGLAREPRTAITVSTDFVAPINVSVPRVALSARAPRETVLISVREGSDPEQLRVETRPEALRAAIEPAGDRFFRIEVSGSEALAGAPAAVVFWLGAEQFRLPVEWRRETP